VRVLSAAQEAHLRLPAGKVHGYDFETGMTETSGCRFLCHPVAMIDL
jgi:hypothetical protein